MLFMLMAEKREAQQLRRKRDNTGSLKSFIFAVAAIGIWVITVYCMYWIKKLYIYFIKKISPRSKH